MIFSVSGLFLRKQARNVFIPPHQCFTANKLRGIRVKSIPTLFYSPVRLENEIKNCRLRLVYDQEADIFILRWLEKVNSPELRKGYEKALRTAEEIGARFWLFDLKGRGPASLQDEEWILAEFFPLLEQALGRHNYFAYLVRPEHYRHLRDYVGLVRLQEYSPITKIHAFMSEVDAVQWLGQCQKRQEPNVPGSPAAPLPK